MYMYSSESYYSKLYQFAIKRPKSKIKKLQKVTYICTSCTDLRLVFLKAMDVKVVGVISLVFPYLMVKQKGYAFQASESHSISKILRMILMFQRFYDRKSFKKFRKYQALCLIYSKASRCTASSCMAQNLRCANFCSENLQLHGFLMFLLLSY